MSKDTAPAAGAVHRFQTDFPPVKSAAAKVLFGGTCTQVSLTEPENGRLAVDGDAVDEPR